ncbi:MAG: maleylacetoacetate isomerase [Bdellovibrionota bacterium]
MTFRLYNYYRSSASYRVRIALNLKGFKYEYVPVHLLKNGGEQKLPDFLKKNPMGQVPCLEHDGRYLSQSMAILFYLDELSKNPALFPKDAFERAKVLEVCEAINSGIQPLQNTAVSAALEKQFSASEAQRAEWNKGWISKGLEALENTLSASAGAYSFGDTVSAADIFIVPQMYAARRFVGPKDKYKTLTKIENNCLKLDAFRLAEPSVQPDATA